MPANLCNCSNERLANGLPLPDPLCVGAAIYTAITGGRHMRTEVSTFAKALGWLRNRNPSTAAMARSLGVPRSTLRRWLAGTSTPRSHRQDSIVNAIRSAQRRLRLTPGRERRLRRAETGEIKMVARYRYDPPNLWRTVDIGRYLDPAMRKELVDSYLAGGTADDFHAIFHDNILDAGFYAQTFDPDIGYGNGWDVREFGWI